jgi:nicotinamide riboside kinase
VELAGLGPPGASVTLHICLTGAESTGKTTAGRAAARAGGAAFLPEYGREHAELWGTQFPAPVLHIIARIHAERRRRLLAARPAVLIEDTDVVTTAAWAVMLHGQRDRTLSAMPSPARHHLLFLPDVPWRDDGTRAFSGAARRRFHDAILAELALRRITPIIIEGPLAKRPATLRAVLDRLAAAAP